MTDGNRVCPVSLAGGLDSGIRKLLQNPSRILDAHVREGMTVLDLGCGPGFFSVEMARRVGESGSVIAVDLQEGMLERLRKKIRGTEFEIRIKLHKGGEDGIGVSQKVDLLFAFYVMHELPDQTAFLSEFRSMLRPNGSLYIAEPKAHVTRRDFEETIRVAESLGFSLTTRLRGLMTRTAVFAKTEPKGSAGPEPLTSISSA